MQDNIHIYRQLLHLSPSITTSITVNYYIYKSLEPLFARLSTSLKKKERKKKEYRGLRPISIFFCGNLF